MRFFLSLLIPLILSQTALAQNHTREFKNKLSAIIEAHGPDSASAYVGNMVADFFMNGNEAPKLDAQGLAEFASENEQKGHRNIAVSLHHLNSAINGESVQARQAHMNYHLRYDEIFPALEEIRRLIELEPGNEEFREKLNQIMAQRDLADIMLDDIREKGLGMGFKTYLEMKTDPSTRNNYDFGLGTFHKLKSQLSVRGRYYRAIEVLLFATQLYPESAETYYLLGEEYQKRGERFDETRALRAFEKVLEIESDHKKAKEAIAALTENS